jgi:3-dehydrosphinganine reductase
MIQWNYLYLIGIVPAAAFVAVVFFLTTRPPRSRIDLSSPAVHVVITGGSSGIGLATAHMIRAFGCSVSLIARDMTKLNAAKEDIDGKNKGKPGCVSVFSADVSNYDQISAAIKESAARYGGRVDVLIASAGVSRPGRFDEIPVQYFESMTKINYLGALYSALAVVPIMKNQKSGRLIFVSSLAGLMGLIGFSGYSPTKFAVRGLAESLQMELQPFGIYTTLVNPPDVDTPMLQEEMQFKPEETKIISEGGGLFTADDIAKDIVSSIQSWRFMVNTGFDGWLLGVLSTNISTPSHSWIRSMTEILLAGPLRFVGLLYVNYWNYVCSSSSYIKSYSTASTTRYDDV